MKAQSGVARETSLPSSTVDRSTGEDNIIMFQQNFMYANSDSGLLFIMCGYCSFGVSINSGPRDRGPGTQGPKFLYIVMLATYSA